MQYPPADPYLIQVAVRAFVVTCLGRRRIVWGGHPAITPMVWAAADDLNVQYSSAVHLFQSSFYQDRYPEINRKFDNVTIVPAVPDQEQASLRRMRNAMLGGDNGQFVGGAFIGGMEGIFEEFELFRDLYPNAPVVLVESAGGATRVLAEKHPELGERTRLPFDYYGLFSERLGISLEETRELRPGLPRR